VKAILHLQIFEKMKPHFGESEFGSGLICKGKLLHGKSVRTA
jgi:hypothetical protein